MGSRSKNQRLHDLKTVQIDFKAVLTLIETGFKFEEAQELPALIAQLEKALKMLKSEIGLLEKEWAKD